MVFTADRTYVFFAASPKERDVWLRYFCRIVDINAGKDAGPGQPGDAYRKAIAEPTRSVTRYNPSQKPLVVKTKSGFDEYDS